jgi:acetyl esterase/lipase
MKEMMKMRISLALAGTVLLLSTATLAHAQAAAPSALPPDAPLPAPLQQAETYRLWAGRAPGASSEAPSETPTLTIFRPPAPSSNGTAVVIAPGGAYIGLAGVLEGTQPASWFTTRGVTAFVLTYRVGATARLPIPLADGARAVRFVRSHAANFKVDPNRIGMMGFSAGGHLAATTAVEATAGRQDSADPVERVSSRPDFLILGYPWLEGMQLKADGVSSYCDFAVRVTKSACTSSDYTSYLPVRSVTTNAPPTFIFHTTDDELVPVEGSVRFYLALLANQVPAEFHGFESGRHGAGLGGSNSALSQWPNLLQEWLRSRNLLPPPR